jgi:DNA polymerase I-like protein with 3'-5' exonuclease and polymerase domains
MGNKNKKTPVISAGLTRNDFDCQLCGENAWRGPKCKDCKLFERAHYTEGVGGVPHKVDFFCVANSPFLSGPSSSLINHQGWTKDIEKIVRAAFLRTININNVFKSFVGRFTYAVRCERKKPLKNNIDCCAPLFHEELLTYSNPKRPIMIFAMGDSVLKALGLKIRKYSKAQEHFITTTLQGRKVYIYVSMSKQQLAAKTGYFDLFKNHMDLFLSGVVDVNKGKAIQITPTLDVLSKHYVFPKTLKEVEKLVDHILAYSENDVNPDNWIISLDTETNTKYPHRKNLKLLSLIVSWATGYATSIPIEHPGTPWTFEQVAPQIQRLLSCPKPKVLQNAKFDLKVLKRKGWDIRRIGWDTMLGEHLLVEDKKGFYGLKDLTNIMLPAYSGYEDTLQAILTSAEGDSQIADAKQSVEKKKKEKLKGAAKKLAKDAETEGFLKVPLDDLNLYGAIDGDVTRQIVALQRARVGQENKALAKRRSQWANNAYFKHLAQPGCSLKDPILSNMFGRVLPTTRVLADMELYGMRVDRDYVDELTVKMELSLQKSQGEMLPMVPENISFNPSSAHDVRKLLYGTGFKHPETGEIICYEGVVEPQRTETGLASTNAQFLRSLATQYDCPLSNAILRYRATHKALTTFVANIKALSEEDGRMHTNFHQHGTATFRLCVSENTILDTDKGSFVISNLPVESSKVYSENFQQSTRFNLAVTTHKNRLRPITMVFYKGTEEMYRVTLENGAFIEITQNHGFYTPLGVLRLNELEIGSEVSTCDYLNTFDISQIKSIRSIGIKGVWDIEVEEDHSYVAQGFVNHNSSSDENMQNVPYQIGEHNIKKSFIPTDPENQVICNADAKAAEVRIYAAYSKDRNLIQALNDGMDPHSFFAGMIFKPEIILAEIEYASQKAVMNLIGIDEEHNWNYDDFNNRANFKDTDPWYAAQLEKLRKTIKRVVFGILYGASKYKIAQIVGISLEQAQTIIDALEKMFPSIPEYVRTTKDQVRNIGVVETFLGRRRRFDLQGLTNYGRSKANRQAINFKIQSTSSDIVLEVLCDVAEPIRQDFGGHLLITVHDSIVAEIPKKYISQLPDFFKEHGQNNVGIRHPWLPVPFKWDVEVGASYGEVIDVYDYMNKNDIERIDPDEYLEQEIRADFEKELAVR